MRPYYSACRSANSVMCQSSGGQGRGWNDTKSSGSNTASFNGLLIPQDRQDVGIGEWKSPSASERNNVVLHRGQWMVSTLILHRHYYPSRHSLSPCAEGTLPHDANAGPCANPRSSKTGTG